MCHLRLRYFAFYAHHVCGAGQESANHASTESCTGVNTALALQAITAKVGSGQGTAPVCRGDVQPRYLVVQHGEFDREK